MDGKIVRQERVCRSNTLAKFADLCKMPSLSQERAKFDARGWLSGRASPSHGGGHWFESSTAHHTKQLRAAFLLSGFRRSFGELCEPPKLFHRLSAKKTRQRINRHRHRRHHRRDAFFSSCDDVGRHRRRHHHSRRRNHRRRHRHHHRDGGEIWSRNVCRLHRQARETMQCRPRQKAQCKRLEKGGGIQAWLSPFRSRYGQLKVSELGV